MAFGISGITSEAARISGNIQRETSRGIEGASETAGITARKSGPGLEKVAKQKKRSEARSQVEQFIEDNPEVSREDLPESDVEAAGLIRDQPARNDLLSRLAARNRQRELARRRGFSESILGGGETLLDPLGTTVDRSRQRSLLGA